MMTRKEMMDDVIARKGFENEGTIWFCSLCEDATLSQDAINLAYELTKLTVEDEEF